MDYYEQLEEWFEKYESQGLKFKDLENKPNECEQVSALVFLASKLKNKSESYFLHGEHDTLYILRISLKKILRCVFIMDYIYQKKEMGFKCMQVCNYG